MTQAVLYARYSTDMQSAASVEDQLRLLRQRATREGWTVVGEQADRAITGTVRRRPGLDACLATIASGHAQILLAEALDRISRDQEDIAGIYKRIRFAGARIVTLSEGDVGTIHIGMGGTISAMYVEQLAEKTRRGQIGRVIAGRIPGGLSYGYRAVRQIGPDGELERGLRELDSDQAKVVRRIFADYVAGISPLAIAAALNTDGVPSPRGGLWRANAIMGHRQRGNGILHNELYIGRIVYNRQTFRKDPDTRRRVARSNQVEDRVVTEVPDLRIIDQELWDQVQERLSLYSNRPSHQARRPKRLLSGLMQCGLCGGNVTIVLPDRWGCSNHKQTGTCTNHVTLSDRQAQRRLLRALQDDLLHPDVIAAYLDELVRLDAEHRRESIAARAQAERRLAAIDAEEARLVDAIAAGLPIESLRARAEALALEKETQRALLADNTVVAPSVHPGMVEHYRRLVAQIHEYTSADDTLRPIARAQLEQLIDKIELHPREGKARGADLIVHGRLAAFLTPQTQKGPAQGEANLMLAMVAGAGFGRWHTIPFAA